MQIADGQDPGAAKRDKKLRLCSDRVDALVEEFLIKHASQNRSFYETERIFRKEIIPILGKRSVHEVTKRDIINLLEPISTRGSPYMANRTLAAVRKFFSWCIGRAILDTSPCSGVSAPGKETSRDRVLTDDELAKVLDAAIQMGFPYREIIWLLALTGQRREEVTAMTRSELDLNTNTWTIPGSRTKNGKPHIVHLSDPAMKVTASVPKQEGTELLFTTNGKTPFSGFSKAKRRLDRDSDVSGWVLHDLRRTLASGLAGLGVRHEVADKVLNHQSGAISGVAAVYQRHEFIEERRDALELWAQHIRGLLPSEEQEDAVHDDGENTDLRAELEQKIDRMLEGRPHLKKTKKRLDLMVDLVQKGISIRKAEKQAVEESNHTQKPGSTRRQYQRREKQKLADEAYKAIVDNKPAKFETAYNELVAIESRGNQRRK